MGNLFEIGGLILGLLVVTSTFLIILFKFAFGDKSKIPGSSFTEKNMFASGLSGREYVQKCIPSKQQKKYQMLLNVQKYSALALFAYMVLGFLIYYVVNT